MITSSTITDVDITAKGFTALNAVTMEKDVFIGGSLSVQGSVMGSGSYVDSSDRRFKREITPIASALDKVLKIQGVRTVYRLLLQQYLEKLDSAI